MEPEEARDPMKPWWRSWAPERMLGDEGREIASSENDAAGVPVEDECEKLIAFLKARIACWPAT